MSHIAETNGSLSAMESEWARQGQWGSHLFLPVKCTRPLARLATACLDHYVSSLDEPLVDLDLPSTELHISLSQHFALRSHQVEPLLRRLSVLLAGQAHTATAVVLLWGDYQVLYSADGTRAFLCLRMDDRTAAVAGLVGCCDTALAEFNQPSYHDGGIWHISIASFAPPAPPAQAPPPPSFAEPATIAAAGPVVEVEGGALRKLLLNNAHEDVSAFIRGCGGRAGSDAGSGSGAGSGDEDGDGDGDEDGGEGLSPGEGVNVTLGSVVCSVGSGHKRYELCLGSLVSSGSGSGGGGGKRGRAPGFRLTQDDVRRGAGAVTDHVGKRQRRI